MFFKKAAPVVCVTLLGSLLLTGCTSGEKTEPNGEVTKSVMTSTPSASSTVAPELKGSEAQQALIKVIADSKAKAEKDGYTEKTTNRDKISIAVYSPNLKRTAMSEANGAPFYIEGFMGVMFEGLTEVAEDKENTYSLANNVYNVMLKDQGGAGFNVTVKDGVIVSVDAVGGSLPTVVEYKITEEGAQIMSAATPLSAQGDIPPAENGIKDTMD